MAFFADAKKTWRAAKEIYLAYKIATVPITIIGGIASAPRFFNYLKEEDYANFYIKNFCAGRFLDPSLQCPQRKPWVSNSAFEQIMDEAVDQASRDHDEKLYWLSGLQMSGKTYTVMHKMSQKQKVGFFFDFANVGKEELNDFVAKKILMPPSKRVNIYYHNCVFNFFKWVAWTAFPAPSMDSKKLLGIFETALTDGDFAVVCDESQLLLNGAVEWKASNDFLNILCRISAWNVVIFIGSEYASQKKLKNFTHIESRTELIYAPSATTAEMKDHVEKRYKGTALEGKTDFIVQQCDGSFYLLNKLDRFMDLDKVKGFARKKVVDYLELTQAGMKDDKRAEHTAEAMIGAAKLAFHNHGDNIQIDNYIRELAQARAAKIYTVGEDEKASFTSGIYADIMKELICDKGIKKVLENNSHLDSKRQGWRPRSSEKSEDFLAIFNQAIEGKCQK
mmetsp:Transcript_51670/g.123006  ORF Transcript_51670/g.123006 Transcript_51670/m.123006 type:complete len:449 (+) Transcript_51670:65-1411(+)